MLKGIRRLIDYLKRELWPPYESVGRKASAQPKVFEETHVSPHSYGFTGFRRARKRTTEARHHLTTGSGDRMGWTVRTSPQRATPPERDITS